MSVLEFNVSTAELDGDGNAFVVTATGEVDMYTAPRLEQALDGVVGLGGTSVVLDLSEVTFVDSTLLSVLLRYRDHLAERGGQLVIVTADRRILGTFETTGLNRLFRIEPRLAEGIAALDTHSQTRSPGA